MPPVASSTRSVARVMGPEAVSARTPDDLPVADQNFPGRGGQNFDRGGGARGADQRAHDFRAGLVAIGVQDARALMRRLQPAGQILRGVAVEAHAGAEQKFDQGRPGLDDAAHRSTIAQPGAGFERVGDVQGRAVVSADRRGQPALRPGTGGAVAEPGGIQQPHRGGAAARAAIKPAMPPPMIVMPASALI